MTARLPDLNREEHNGFSGYVLEHCTSTMDMAWALMDRGMLPPWSWVRANEQTLGRGQFGRAWQSDAGNLFVTLRLPDASRNLGGILSLGIALAIVQALGHLGAPVLVKWPNDIVAGYAKLGGILIETRQEFVLAGIGINVLTAPESSCTERFFGIQAGCLKSFGVNLKTSEVWSSILEELIKQIPPMIADPATVVERLPDVLAWVGETVILENTGTHDGPARIIGIDAQGRLLIHTTHGPSAILSGRIIPRTA